MPKSNFPQYKWNIIILSIAILDIGLDQLTKWWIDKNFYVGQSVPAEGFFRLTYVHNTGAAFSIFENGVSILAWVSLIGAIIALFFIFWALPRLPMLNTRVNKIALGLILGGICGNMIDRFWLHYVRDFVDVSIWPVFNVSDSSMVVGIIIFAFSILFLTKSKPEEKPKISTETKQ
jgi:signal peptidase II